MCKYCYVDDYGESYGRTFGHQIINETTIWDARIYGDDATIRISSDLKPKEKVIKINYCPMCGRKIRDEVKADE